MTRSCGGEARRTQSSMPTGRLAILVLLFFCSGACGLIYQVLWLRQLSIVLGVTVYAASTVLAAFMTGLALGSALAGRVLSWLKRPVVAFGLAEILIGLAALATPAALTAAVAVYETAYRAGADSPSLLTLGRVIAAFLVLLAPTVLMGLTLPILSASSLVGGAQMGSRIGLLYAANTAGAVTGATLAGFWFIGGLGMHRTFLLAAGVNVAIGLTALWLARGVVDSHRPSLTADDANTGAPDGGRGRAGLAVQSVVAISGAASLALEIVWFRILLQFVPATTYAFTGMLATVLAGIAVGGAVAARALTRERDWHGILCRILFATAIVVVLSVILLTTTYSTAWGASAVIRASAIAIFPAAVLMGAAFPIALHLGRLSSGANATAVARQVGRLYALNVAGAIVGALTGGFLLLPGLGSRGSLLLLASLYVASAFILLTAHATRRRLVWRAALGTMAFGAAALALPDPFVAALERRYGTEQREIWRDEGVQTAVSVHQRGAERILYLDGLHQANDTPSMIHTHRMIGHLPMVLHPSPSDVLVVGLGGGVTAGAVSRHVGSRVLVVELSDSVRRAAPLFAHVNDDVLNQPHVRVRVDDGRNFLRLTSERFDVITADIIQPTHAGAGLLYSREYFGLMRQALRPGGLVLQWIGRRPEVRYKLIMRSFLDVFPDATLWHDGQLLVGSLGPLRVNLTALDTRLASPRTRAALETVGLKDAATLSAWFTAGPELLRRFVGDGPILTDDQPLLEYHRSLPRQDPMVDLSGLHGDPAEVIGP